MTFKILIQALVTVLTLANSVVFATPWSQVEGEYQLQSMDSLGVLKPTKIFVALNAGSVHISGELIGTCIDEYNIEYESHDFSPQTFSLNSQLSGANDCKLTSMNLFYDIVPQPLKLVRSYVPLSLYGPFFKKGYLGLLVKVGFQK
ncbi:MAG TPA: hypothetical protein VNJ01_00025 [Bacteriovoracaceae bacterium]|nr:hypothetical protein [Bacteriovoracaceae bacterium]